MRIPALKKIFVSLALTFVFFGAPAAMAQEEIYRPTLSVNIPTVKFSDIQVQKADKAAGVSGYIDVPWIAEYVLGVYRYGVAVAGIVAGVTIVIGGWYYMTGKAAEGKALIRRSLIGVVLVLGSYVILRTISPDLTSFDALRLKVVSQELFTYDEPPGVEEGVLAPNGSAAAPPAAGSDTVAFDEYFKKYAPCAGIDWRILKAVAKKESGFNPTVTNKWGFVGLFQTKPQFCSLGGYGRGSECTVDGLKNPDSNTASAANGQIRSAVNIIKAKCPSLRDPQQFTMFIYYAHNSGAGALKSVLNKVGCDGTNEQYFQASSDFWSARSASTGKTIPNQNGRMQYAQKVANTAVGYGVTDPLAVTGECPL